MSGRVRRRSAVNVVVLSLSVATALIGLGFLTLIGWTLVSRGLTALNYSHKKTSIWDWSPSKSASLSSLALIVATTGFGIERLPATVRMLLISKVDLCGLK